MLVDDLVDLLVAVLFQLGVVHGGSAVAQRLLGGQGAAAGQQGVLVQNLGQGLTGQQEQVDVAAVGLVVAVALPVAGQLLAKVEHAVVGVVVEQANRAQVVFVYPDIEGNVLVHRVAGLGVVADGILGGHPQAATLFIQMTGLFAKAVEVVIVPIHLGEVAQTADLILLKGALPQILIDQLAGLIEQLKVEGLFEQLQGDVCGLKGQGLLVLGAGHIQRGDAGALVLEQGVHPVLPRGGHQRVGLLLHGGALVEVHPDADDIVCHENQLYISGIAVDEVAVFGLFKGFKTTQQHKRFLRVALTYQSGRTARTKRSGRSPWQDLRT